MKCFTEVLKKNNAELTIYLHDSSKEMENCKLRPAVLIFPGGGYFMCSDREAEPIALAYMAEGYNAFVLRYSVGEKATFDMALEDAEEALRTLRSRAQEWGIHAQKIACVGFSAGGHLAASLGTVSDDKPNALILGYPVTMAKMGPPVGKDIVATDENISETTPPTFIFSTSDDGIVPIENTLSFASALAKHKIYFELHVYLSGAHGMSLAKSWTSGGNHKHVNDEASEWVDTSIKFLTKIWGDFPFGGIEEPSLLEKLKVLNLDYPVGKLIADERIAKNFEEIFPGIASHFCNNPISAGTSLRSLAKYDPTVFTNEKLAEFEIILQAVQK